MTDGQVSAPAGALNKRVDSEVQGGVTEAEGPQMMSWDSKTRRVVVVYIPLLIFLFVLLFPFYWMGVTTFKPDSELLDFKNSNPFWVASPTLANIKKLLFDTDYGH